MSSPENPFSQFTGLAVYLHEVYTSLLDVGFLEYQATQLTVTLLNVIASKTNLDQ